MGDPARKLPAEAHAILERVAVELPRALEEWGVTSPKLQRAIFETLRKNLDAPNVRRLRPDPDLDARAARYAKKVG